MIVEPKPEFHDKKCISLSTSPLFNISVNQTSLPPLEAFAQETTTNENFQDDEITENSLLEEDSIDQFDDGEYLEEEPQYESDYNTTTEDIEDVKFIVEEENCTKIFVCQYCEKSFASRSGRDTHQQIKHKAPQNFDERSFEEHETEMILESGQTIRVWKCPLCNLISKKRSHHQTHLIRHAIRDKTEEQERIDVDSAMIAAEMMDTVNQSPSKRKETCYVLRENDHYSCSKCGAKYQEEETAKIHVQKYGNTGFCTGYLCMKCDVVFPSFKLFKNHESFHMLAPISGSLKFFECTVCLVVFGKQKDLAAHIENHDDDYQYEVEHSTQLDGAELLTFDLNHENDKNDFHCGYCIKTGNLNDVNFHVALFHGNLVCPFDKREFSRAGNYFVVSLLVSQCSLH